MLKSIKMLKVIEDKKKSQDVGTYNIISQIMQYNLFPITTS